MQRIIDEILDEGRIRIPYGKTATYIPELSKMNQEYLGICIHTREGEVYKSGDAGVRFTIQSISKVISLAVALEVCGYEAIFAAVGMEPSGESFNSLITLDLDSDHPHNPMLNSGAIAISSYLAGEIPFEKMLTFTRKLCMDEEIVLDEKTYQSEFDHLSRNRAIAYLLDQRYSGYRNGLKHFTAAEMRASHPDRMIKEAVWGMLPKNNIARKMMTRLRVFAGESHVHAAQKPVEIKL